MSSILSKLVNLAGNIVGKLKIINGGTNSSTALNNNRVIQSSGGAIVEASAITASRALASDTNGIPVASATTAVELGYVNGVTSSIQTQINNITPQAPTVNAWVYVSQYGSDITGDGTYNKPFATTAAALAIITDATTTKRYGIHIKGTISEANIYIKPYVWYYGDTWGSSRLNATSSNNIQLSPGDFATGNSRCGFTNIYLTGSTGINLDFVAQTASGSHVIELAAIGVNGSITSNPNNTNQYIQLEGDNLVFGNMTLHGALGLIFNTFLVGNLVIDQMSTAQATGGVNFANMFFGSNVTLSTSGSFANPIQMSACTTTGTLSVTGTGCTLTADAISLPLKAQITTATGGSIVRTTDVFGSAYAPTTSGDWNSAPTTGQAGLDTLATSGVVKSQTQNKVLASPNGSSGVSSFRALVTADLPGGTGTVTSVALTVPSILSISGSPITSSGTLAIGYSGTALPILNGGTGQTTAAAAFVALSPLTTKGDIIYEDATPTPVRLPIGSPGNVLTVSGGLPVWSSASTGTVTSVAMTVPTFLSISGSPVTTSGTLAVTLSGTALPIANGGTAVTSVTTAPAATAFAGWDANKNLSANNVIAGYTTTATAAGTTTLVVGSTYEQIFTGVTTQIVVLPVVSTLVLGQQFSITNSSTGIVTVNSSGSNLVLSMIPGSSAIFTTILVTGTTAASWGYALQVTSSGTPGQITGSAAGAGYIGETVFGPANKNTAGLVSLTTATIKNLQTLAIPSAGVWFITAQAQFQQGNNAFVPTTTFDFTVSTSSTNMTGCIGNNACIDYQSMYPPAITGGVSVTPTSGMIAFTYVASASITLNLNCLISFSAGTANARGGCQAVRIA